MTPQSLRHSSNLGLNGLKLLIQNEYKAFFRNKGTFLSQIIQPVLYFIFIVIGINSFVDNVTYNEIVVSYTNYALTGILGILIISQMTQAIYRVTIDKKYGLLALKIQSGISPFFYLLGMSTYPTLGFIIQSISLFLIANIFGHGFSIISSLLVMLFCVFILLFWTSIGIMITLRINNYNTRDNIISFLITPLGFSAPAFYFLEDVPTFIRLLAYINPLTYQLSAIRGLAFNHINLIVFSIPLLFLILVLFVASKIISNTDLELTEF
ncbi:ABC transporter permease [Marinilactibacillus sp. Marseille-P9653]|uniref:ABC transporter permease n=1 Tax=Marinilactibacillus sp. Marseille-P9653 TaxID=2866583 RepID=UPI001CE425A0|nr:ABC transporter permease [Marinilactibacillus sp. Marseille-P9653]